MSQDHLPNLDTAASAAAHLRRRLIKGGLSATPLLLTLAGRPAHATCKNPSGFSVSGNLSRPANFVCNGSSMGKKPSEWRYDPNWPYPLNCNSSKMSLITGNSADTATILSKLQDSGVSENDKYAIAAFLNAYAGRTPASATEAKKIWAGRNGGYSPTPGVIWSKAQVLTYLKHTTGEL